MSETRNEPSSFGRRTMLAGGIRFGGLALSFAFFLAIARATSPEDFGAFALFFSLATVLAYIANLGQHVAILRFWPAIDDGLGTAAANRVLGTSLALVAAGSLTTFLLFVLAGATGNHQFIWAGALTASLALAEFAASALRARNAIVSALAPRDVLWRILVIFAVLAWPSALSATEVLAMTTLVLVVATAPQIAVLLVDVAMAKRVPLPKEQQSAFLKSTPFYWLSSSIGPLTEYATTIIVGIVLGPLAAGLYFAADRLAKLLASGIVSVEQVVAADLSRTWHRGDKSRVRAIAQSASLIGVMIAAIGAVFYLLCGHLLLAAFDPSFADGYPILLVLVLGQLINAYTGANTMLLNIAGAERALLFVRLFWGAMAVLFAVIGATHFGVMGAALASMCVLIGWNVTAVVLCRYMLGIWTIALPVISSATARPPIRAPHH